MKAIRELAMLCMALGSVAVQAEGGLRVAPEEAPWPRWQARVGMDLAPPWRGSELSPSGGGLRSMKLLGDVYLSGPGFGDGQVQGGLRATGGLLLGSRSPLLGTASVAPLSVNVRHSLLPPGRGDEAFDAPPVGYLGIGYSSLSLRGGWGFSADLGVMTGSGLRPPETRSSLDEAVRELRLRPVLQLGVSYAF
ncbi:hypothetical protein [Azohydromonas caseinilytica]|uniref:Outer membrane protein beta-barrel domain-containing protein n=1 Tax=Azohydromonas caseinilytica TaxID=2728836 RepID=A0A848F9Q4_9BURK|nr:hypothetical protein [Azohydromonas caseinilytica]NML15189.1 hypothetical protein [Azohydromonas caseinilytica]